MTMTLAAGRMQLRLLLPLRWQLRQPPLLLLLLLLLPARVAETASC